MSQTTPPTITAAPDVPIRGTPTFKTRVDGFLTWMALAATQLSALATNCYNNAVDCFNNAVAAAASASGAAASAIAASGSSGATLWTAGTYAAGTNKYSPTTFYTYRNKTGAGTTDPATDTTNWVLLSAAYARTYLHVREQQASNTAGGASVSADITQTRVLNTTVVNTVVGASVASNQVTLPAGTYVVRGRAPATGVGNSKAFLYNITDSTYALIGSTSANNATSTHGDSVLIGLITIAATKVFSIRHFTGAAVAANGLGAAAGTGQVEVYTEALFEKIA